MNKENRMPDTKRHKTLTKESIEDILKEMVNTPPKTNNTLLTGKRGAYAFDTEMTISGSKDLAENYRRLRDAYYSLNEKYIKASIPWKKKLYNWFRNKIK